MDNWVTLNINVVSAAGINITTKNTLYVVVLISGEGQREQKAKTNVNKEGGRNPSWNFPMKFDVNESAAKQGLDSHITFTIKHNYIFRPKYVGEVKVLITELLQSAKNGNSMQNVSRQIQKTSKRLNGILNFEYNFEYKPLPPRPPQPPYWNRQQHTSSPSSSSPPPPPPLPPPFYWSRPPPPPPPPPPSYWSRPPPPPPSSYWNRPPPPPPPPPPFYWSRPRPPPPPPYPVYNPLANGPLKDAAVEIAAAVVTDIVVDALGTIGA